MQPMTIETIFEDILSKTNPKVIICFFLVLANAVVYWQVGHHDFINFDDDVYVSENRHVQSGLKQDEIIWSFRLLNKNNTYWHPLTWMSHMLDAQLYGMNPGRHHMTNVLIHIVSSIILFLVCHRMTGAIWRSAFVASLFALHPINVESVAWVAERKNVLSTLFWMLTLGCYVYYTEKPKFSKYLLLFTVFALGLLAKPMLVTLPFVLLLLDYWPLERLKIRFLTVNKNKRTQQPISSNFRETNNWRLVFEKFPLLAVSMVSVWLSSLSLQSQAEFKTMDDVAMMLRIANALTSYLEYIAKVIWPYYLAIFYPYPETVPLWQAVGALVILAGLSVLFIWTFRSRPYLSVGWLWFMGTLVPVSGLVIAGNFPALADRWAYVPTVGLFVMIAWSMPDFVKRWSHYQVGIGVIIIVIVFTLMTTTWVQTRNWKNSVTLYQHALKVNPNNWLAHTNLGTALANKGQETEAYRHFAEAIRLHPHEPHVQVNYGDVMLARGKIKKAAGHYYEALRINPGFAEAYNNLGLILVRSGKIEESIEQFQLAMQNRPDYDNAIKNLNLAISINRKINQAAKNFNESLIFDLRDPQLDTKINDILTRKAELNNILTKFQKSLSGQPGFGGLDTDDIPVVLSAKRQYEKKLPMFKKVIEIWPENAGAYYNIACIYGRQGKNRESINMLNKAFQNEFDRWNLIRADFDLQK
jgi:tetratricopeptide (TPR) repeat protein